MFFPEPNVDSCVIRLDKKNLYYNKTFIDRFKRVVNSAFAMRRKTLANNLKSSFSLSMEKVSEVLANCGFRADIRGEAIGIEDFVLLSNELNKILR